MLNFEKKISIKETFKLQTDYMQKYCTFYLFIYLQVFIYNLLLFF